MNEREEILENSSALDSPLDSAQAPSAKIPTGPSGEMEESAGEAEYVDPTSLGKADTSGAGEPSDHSSGGKPIADPLPDPMPVTEDLESLRGELNRLREELAKQKTSLERMDRECEEFHSLYPSTPLSSLPDEVWEEVEKGIPVAAAYAYVERRRQRAAEIARKSNLENHGRSTGCIRNENRDYLSPSEVRTMSREEVRKNYALIMQSMNHWNS